MVGSAILSSVGFLAAILFVPYWQLHRAEGFELLVALVILPLYVIKFLQQPGEGKSACPGGEPR